jgi:hypothetical protein
MKMSLHLPQRLKNNSNPFSIASALNRVWGQHSGFRLEIEFVESPDVPGTIKIVATEKSSSHVHADYPQTIFMNTNIFGAEFDNTLAHELGHILGFPDCYVTLYDQGTKSIVYYELDQENFMCSPASLGKLPKDYIDQVTAQVCDF